MRQTKKLLFATTMLCGLLAGPAVAALDKEQAAAQQAVIKVLKDPTDVRFGTFTLAGPRGACLTVFKKNWQTLGTSEAFLMRKDGGWEALYVADIASGHQGCIDEMSKR
jgi:hypothetical protein